MHVDSEWYTKDGKTCLLTYQIECKKKLFLYYDPQVLSPEIVAENIEKGVITYPLPSNELIIDHWIRYNPHIFAGYRHPKSGDYLIDLCFYFSLKDVRYLFGDKFIERLLTQKFPNTKKDGFQSFITHQKIYWGYFKKHTLVGTCYSFRLRDYYGWNSRGLNSLFKLLNITSDEKENDLIDKSAILYDYR